MALRKVAMGGIAFGAGAYLTTRYLNGEENNNMQVRYIIKSHIITKLCI